MFYINKIKKYLHKKKREKKLDTITLDFIKTYPADSLFYIHPNKCGGTSISNTFEAIEKKSAKKICYKGHSLKLKLLNKKSQYFFSIRDPIKRFYSGYYSRLKLNYDRPAEKLAFNKFPSANILAESLNSKNKDTKKNALEAIYSIGDIKYHYDFWFKISELKKNPPFYILETEKLNQDFEGLCKKLKISSINLPNNEIDRNANDNKDKEPISNNGMINLRNHYLRDYKIYNYILSIKSKINL